MMRILVLHFSAGDREPIAEAGRAICIAQGRRLADAALGLAR